MLEFVLSVGMLGRTTFGFSPLAEVASSLRLLGAPPTSHVHTPWLRDVRSALTKVDLATLTALAPPGPLAAGFLYAAGTTRTATIEEQLQGVANLDPATIRADLERVWAGKTPPEIVVTLRRSKTPGTRIAEAVWSYWSMTIEPYWPRMRAVLEDDIAYRFARATSGGLLALLGDLHPQVTATDEVLSIDLPGHPDACYAGNELTLTPSIFVWPKVIINHDDSGRFSLTYAARGVARVWEGLPPAEGRPTPLAMLLGRTRAAILASLDVPRTTTELANELHQSPASISEHLAVLRDSCLVISWRSGRRVLYRQTPLAASVLAANPVRNR